MNKTRKILSVVLAIMLIVSIVPVGSAFADNDGKWVSAWSTSPIDASLNDLGLLDQIGVPIALASSRVTIQSTATGSQIRLTFSNQYGNLPLTISGCTVAKATDDHRVIDKDSRETVRFGGKLIKIIPAGQVVTSDPIDIDVVAGEELTVTTYYRGLNVMRTIGLIGGDSYVSAGNFTYLKTMYTGINLKFEADSGSYEVIPSLIGMEVKASQGTDVCVIFGDSTVANEIPRLLEAKLQANGITNVSVTQEAIKGNRLIADGIGAAAKVLGQAGVDRFQQDVLGQAGVKYVIVKLGINDVVHPHCESKIEKGIQPVSLEDMIAGYNQLIAMAHNAGVEIYFCELTPWEGYTRNVFGAGDDVQWCEEFDQLRVDINAWFASSDCAADGWIDMSGMCDPTHPTQLIPGQTPDGIHHNAAGQANFVSLVPVDIFK